MQSLNNTNNTNNKKSRSGPEENKRTKHEQEKNIQRKKHPIHATNNGSEVKKKANSEPKAHKKPRQVTKRKNS